MHIIIYFQICYLINVSKSLIFCLKCPQTTNLAILWCLVRYPPPPGFKDLAKIKELLHVGIYHYIQCLNLWTKNFFVEVSAFSYSLSFFYIIYRLRYIFLGMHLFNIYHPCPNIFQFSISWWMAQIQAKSWCYQLTFKPTLKMGLGAINLSLMG